MGKKICRRNMGWPVLKRVADARHSYDEIFSRAASEEHSSNKQISTLASIRAIQLCRKTLSNVGSRGNVFTS